jgi:hypothetical protein
MPGFLTNGLPMLAQVSARMLVNADTQFQRGAAPQSIAASALQIAAAIGDCILNAATSTAGAVTQNTLGGLVTTEALTIAPGATYSFTLTNSQITQAYLSGAPPAGGAEIGSSLVYPYFPNFSNFQGQWYLGGGQPEAMLYSGTNTGGTVPGNMSAQMALVSVIPAVGSVTFTWRNVGQTALNGTMCLIWHL